MGWFVFISFPAKGGTQIATAQVVGPMTQAQFNGKYGTNNPLNPPGGGGFKSKTAAQAKANEYNSRPSEQRKFGVQAPTVFPKVKAPNLFHGLHLETVLLRVGEIALGILLIGVGVAKLTGVDNQIMKLATKAGKLAIM
jgi:hypothetical protein